uniref:Uncharacterized protein n=1 Tax=Myotis myotis TaxID=51298 RepID=A0A7J7RT05_MYOMY|nr:hypothetical protein mMyoMyo1_010190 [Myotis myotis]
MVGWASPPWLRVSSGPAARWSAESSLGGGAVMWATSEDQNRLPDFQRGASAQARAAFDVILKMLTHANYIFQNSALCWGGREKAFSNTRNFGLRRADVLPRANPSNCRFLSTFTVSAVGRERRREPIWRETCSEYLPVRREPGPGAWEIPQWPH